MCIFHQWGRWTFPVEREEKITRSWGLSCTTDVVETKRFWQSRTCDRCGLVVERKTKAEK